MPCFGLWRQKPVCVPVELSSPCAAPAATGLHTHVSAPDNNNAPFDSPMMIHTMSNRDGRLPADATANATTPDGPLTVIELFQSQGCSSCPPANANVLRLIDDPTKLVLTYDVTYWDHLGWKDTFGSPANDERQRQYIHALDKRNAYTPQVIVNGRADGVGATPQDLSNIVVQGTSNSPTGVNIAINPDFGIVKVTGPKGTVAMMQDALVLAVR
ncbi:hypothetical protein ANO11243_056250 [Dothideomycetidae sp. 11243]|nr:hypothetical protein ANO11243_056250 [fungal sp. No.11243]